MWADVTINLPMNDESYRYIAGYFNKKGSPVFYKNRGMITNHYWDSDKFNSIKKCRAVYGNECRVFKLNFEFKLQVESA